MNVPPWELSWDQNKISWRQRAIEAEQAELWAEGERAKRAAKRRRSRGG